MILSRLKVDSRFNVDFRKILSFYHFQRSLAVISNSEKSLDSSTFKSTNYEKKYAEKLLIKAKEAGLNSIKELKDHYKSKVTHSKCESPINPLSHPLIRQTYLDSLAQSKLPPHVKPLNQIVHIDKLMKEPPETIEALWLDYQSTKPVVSAVIPGDVYMILHERAKQFPKFVLPVFQDGSRAENFLLEHSGHQTFFTSMAHYQRFGSEAPVLLSLTYYTDLLATKDKVLVHGHPEQISLITAQRLVQLMRHFYLDHEFEWVQKLHLEPSNFHFDDVLKAVQERIKSFKQQT